MSNRKIAKRIIVEDIFSENIKIRVDEEEEKFRVNVFFDRNK